MVKVKKIFVSIAVMLCMACMLMFGMGNTLMANAEEIPENTFVEQVYSFEEDDISYNLTLTSEENFKLIANNKGSEASITGTYVIEDDIITIIVAGEEFAKFKLNADNTMELVVETEIEDEGGNKVDVPLTPEDYKAQIEELTGLIEQLHSELNKEEVNYEEVGKIAVAILGIVGMIILGLLIVIIRLKIKNINKDKLYQDVREQTDKVFADYQKEVKGLIEDVKVTVTKKIDDNEEKRQAEAEAQSIKLRASVEAAKANLSINSVLDE